MLPNHLRTGLPSQTEEPSVDAFLQQMYETFVQTRAYLDEAQDRMQRQENKKKRDHTIAPGDQVLLSTQFLKVQGKSLTKLAPLWTGPYEVLSLIGRNAVRLKVPGHLHIHDISPILPP